MLRSATKAAPAQGDEIARHMRREQPCRPMKPAVSTKPPLKLRSSMNQDLFTLARIKYSSLLAHD
jgi:hypothetical protein